MDIGSKKGALIVSIVPDSPADNSGLMEEDVIIKVDSNEIENDKDLIRSVSSKHPDDYTTFTVIRENEKLIISVTLEKRPYEVDLVTKNNNTESFDILGLKVSDLSNRNGVKIISSILITGLYVKGIILEIDTTSFSSIHALTFVVSDILKKSI